LVFLWRRSLISGINWLFQKKNRKKILLQAI
jgi:hypothetical protein